MKAEYDQLIRDVLKDYAGAWPWILWASGPYVETETRELHAACHDRLLQALRAMGDLRELGENQMSGYKQFGKDRIDVAKADLDALLQAIEISRFDDTASDRVASNLAIAKALGPFARDHRFKEIFPYGQRLMRNLKTGEIVG